MTISNARIRFVAVSILTCTLKQQDKGKSKIKSNAIAYSQQFSLWLLICLSSQILNEGICFSKIAITNILNSYRQIKTKFS